MQNTPTFDNKSAERYKFTHGKAPRGSGAWLFLLRRNDGAYTTVEFTATYSDAKRQAIAVGRSMGCESVSVES